MVQWQVATPAHVYKSDALFSHLLKSPPLLLCYPPLFHQILLLHYYITSVVTKARSSPSLIPSSTFLHPLFHHHHFSILSSITSDCYSFPLALSNPPCQAYLPTFHGSLSLVCQKLGRIIPEEGRQKRLLPSYPLQSSSPISVGVTPSTKPTFRSKE